MSKSTEATVKHPKKLARQQIASTLELALAEMKDSWSEKQFKSKIKKASKVLATGISKKKTLPLATQSNKIVLSTDVESAATERTAE